MVPGGTSKRKKPKLGVNQLDILDKENIEQLSINDLRRAVKHFFDSLRACKGSNNINDAARLKRQRNIFAQALMCQMLDPDASSTKIDLHYLNAIEAATAMDKYLDLHISKLRDSNKDSINIRVITGQGNHSVNGIPIIKNNSIKRLEERKLHFKFPGHNPGCLSVRLEKSSLQSNEL